MKSPLHFTDIYEELFYKALRIRLFEERLIELCPLFRNPEKATTLNQRIDGSFFDIGRIIELTNQSSITYCEL